MKVDFSEILDAFDFVSFAGMGELQAFLDKETGKVYCHSQFDEEFDELPEDIDSDRYIEIPHKRELGLGNRLVFDFAHRYLEQDEERIRDIFGRKGAYSRFKALLEDRDKLEQWYEFEEKEKEEALREWCEDCSIQVNG
ncbi:MAG: hypothetical protein LGR52_16305 [Candidatus Thiosymbion ectosymbiont of Robbea hypermnestra]|nr:hypothetical protein [Candidatus Thiosymbion ectosymbiont of Robbea hypermnestra]